MKKIILAATIFFLITGCTLMSVAKQEFTLERRFSNDNSISVEIPSDWHFIGGPSSIEAYSKNRNEVPFLDGVVYRIRRQLSLSEFSGEYYEHLLAKGFSQIGEKHISGENEVIVREFLKNKSSINDTEDSLYGITISIRDGGSYGFFTLLTNKEDYDSNRAFYEKILAAIK
ncbi:MAG: hypothetical protein LBF16_04655, partial [Pseudomonadales bacterium]|nr:hypothetical protein [Pseudomonadales bacterium]